MNDLSGKTALVIGGSRGIGFALSSGMAGQGARIAIAARTPSEVEAAAESLKARGAAAEGYIVDVTQRGDLETLRDRIAQDLGPLDILVNCQGTTVIKPATEVSEEEYDTVMQVNLRSVFFACTILGAPMLERGRGAVINIASLAGHRGWPNATAYAMSKQGVLGLTRSLAAEWADRGVRVNSISPGVFLTDLNRDKMPKARKEAAMTRTPAGRFGEVGELVGAACFLASDAAGYVTGTDIAVDGGYLAGGI